MLDFLNSKKGSIILSVLLGLALASLFRKVCIDGNCVIIEGPSLDKIENKIFQQDNKCYTYKTKSTSCKK
jgi:hypothetical protein